MPASITDSFVQLYDAEVKAAYQREGSTLRNTIRQRSGVAGERIYFPKIGKGMATQKARNADVTPMNIETSKVYATMNDFYAPEYLDELDLAKINWSVRTETARAAAWAIGRTVDANIINTITGVTTNVSSAGTINGGGNTALSLPVVTGVAKTLNNRDVPSDRNRYAVISPDALDELLRVDQATNLDYVREQLLVSGDKPTFWMGFNWIVHTGLPATVGGAAFKGMFYHKMSAGMGFNQEIKSRVDWIPDKVAWLVNSYASFGSVAIDTDGIQLLTV